MDLKLHDFRTSLSLVIPVLNQLNFTKICLDSIQSEDLPGVEIIVVDNGSDDGTAEFLQAQGGILTISNEKNLGVAAAWNQGAEKAQGEWIIFANNDIIVSPGWLKGLLEAAHEHRFDIVSPGIREGEYNYDISEYSREYVTRMKDVFRHGVSDGICFMVNRGVFGKIGSFDENFRIGQFEDADFFHRAKLAGFRLGTTGRAIIHHFGSVTQDAIRPGKRTGSYERENRLYYRRKWKQYWWRRRMKRTAQAFRQFVWRSKERTFHGHSLKERWIGDRLRYY